MPPPSDFKLPFGPGFKPEPPWYPYLDGAWFPDILHRWYNLKTDNYYLAPMPRMAPFLDCTGLYVALTGIGKYQLEYRGIVRDAFLIERAVPRHPSKGPKGPK